VWNTGDKVLRNIVEEQEYGDYILPFTVLRRLECLLEDTKTEVIEHVASLPDMPPHLIEIAVKQKFGLSYYNISKLDLKTIASVDDNVDKSLMEYISGFSHNIADVWTRSEEHTSELQSRFDLVCRLLLEKKKTNCILSL